MKLRRKGVHIDRMGVLLILSSYGGREGLYRQFKGY